MTDAKDKILATKGRFFSTVFVKKDGSERKMIARIGVKKHLRGGENKLGNHPELITVWDCQKKQYRCINSNTVKQFKCGNL